MSEITEYMHRVASQLYGSNAKTFKLLTEQWEILKNAQVWLINNRYNEH